MVGPTVNRFFFDLVVYWDISPERKAQCWDLKVSSSCRISGDSFFFSLTFLFMLRLKQFSVFFNVLIFSNWNLLLKKGKSFIISRSQLRKIRLLGSHRSVSCLWQKALCISFNFGGNFLYKFYVLKLFFINGVSCHLRGIGFDGIRYTNDSVVRG